MPIFPHPESSGSIHDIVVSNSLDEVNSGRWDQLASSIPVVQAYIRLVTALEDCQDTVANSQTMDMGDESIVSKIDNDDWLVFNGALVLQQLARCLVRFDERFLELRRSGSDDLFIDLSRTIISKCVDPKKYQRRLALLTDSPVAAGLVQLGAHYAVLATSSLLTGATEGETPTTILRRLRKLLAVLSHCLFLSSSGAGSGSSATSKELDGSEREQRILHRSLLQPYHLDPDMVGRNVSCLQCFLHCLHLSDTPEVVHLALILVKRTAQAMPNTFLPTLGPERCRELGQSAFRLLSDPPKMKVSQTQLSDDQTTGADQAMALGLQIAATDLVTALVTWQAGAAAAGFVKHQIDGTETGGKHVHFASASTSTSQATGVAGSQADLDPGPLIYAAMASNCKLEQGGHVADFSAQLAISLTELLTQIWWAQDAYLEETVAHLRGKPDFWNIVTLPVFSVAPDVITKLTVLLPVLKLLTAEFYYDDETSTGGGDTVNKDAGLTGKVPLLATAAADGKETNKELGPGAAADLKSCLKPTKPGSANREALLTLLKQFFEPKNLAIVLQGLTAAASSAEEVETGLVPRGSKIDMVDAVNTLENLLLVLSDKVTKFTMEPASRVLVFRFLAGLLKVESMTEGLPDLPLKSATLECLLRLFMPYSGELKDKDWSVVIGDLLSLVDRLTDDRQEGVLPLERVRPGFISNLAHVFHQCVSQYKERAPIADASVEFVEPMAKLLDFSLHAYMDRPAAQEAVTARLARRKTRAKAAKQHPPATPSQPPEPDPCSRALRKLGS